VEVSGRSYLKTEFFLPAQHPCPDNYQEALEAFQRRGSGSSNGTGEEQQQQQQQRQQQQQDGAAAAPTAVEESAAAAAPSTAGPAGLLPIGVTTYTQLFSDAELRAIEEASGKDHCCLLPAACCLPPAVDVLLWLAILLLAGNMHPAFWP
jgi:hypothetical protein